jgi:hypothetical protein
MKKLFSLISSLVVLGSYGQDTTKTAEKIPFEGFDITWINGQNRQKDFPLTLKDKKSGETILTGVALLDTYYNYNFANPIDNTQTISATVGRANEFTVNLATVGMETNYKNIIGRVWLQYGQMSAIIQDQDASINRGRNTNISNLKYIREAAAGYHFNKWYGVNFEMGIFMSYIGLESYMTQENWCYQRSLPCDFTPFYFSGARIQAFPTKKYKTELWVLNGWQSYNGFAKGPGLGWSNYVRPNENLQLVANFYYSHDTQYMDTLGSTSHRYRFHHDNSIVARYFHNKESKGLSQAALSFNSHYGFQSNNQKNDTLDRKHNFFTGISVANRLWFCKNKLGFTLRGDYINNQSVVNSVNTSPYLAFTPAAQGTVPNDYDIALSQNKKLELFQFTTTFDIMPNDHVTFRLEYVHRESSVPYFAGHGGTTSPSGYTNGPQTQIPWKPDLRKQEDRFTVAVNFRL